MSHTTKISRIITEVSSLDQQGTPHSYLKRDMWADLQALTLEVIRLRRVEKKLNAAIRIKDKRNKLLRINLERFAAPGTDTDLIIKQSEGHHETTYTNGKG